MKKSLNLTISFLLILVACKKDKTAPSATTNSTEISLEANTSNTGATYNSTLSDVSIKNIREVGFVWSNKIEPAIGSAESYSAKIDPPALKFSYKVSSGLSKDSTYYVKAYYLDTANIYHYSKQKSFKSTGTKKLTISDLTRSYTWGDMVDLTTDTTKVSDINGIDIIINKTLIIHPSKINGKQISFKVPNELQSQSNAVIVSIYGQESNPVYLSLNYPQITPGGDTKLVSGSTLTLNGSYFNPTLTENKVSIGSTALTVVSATPTQLVVKGDNSSISSSGYLKIQTGINLTASSYSDYYFYRFLTPKKNFPGEARAGAVAVTIKGKVYYGLGRSTTHSTGLADWWVYDPATDAWSQLADCPQTAFAVNSFSIGNKAYIGMGTMEGYFSSGFYAYDVTTNTWKMTRQFPDGWVFSSVSFSSDRYGYMVGGSKNTGSAIVNLNSTWRYDPLNDIWTKLSDFPGLAFSDGVSFTLDNKAYVIEGNISIQPYIGRDTWAFDFATEKWTQVANIPSAAGTVGAFAFATQNRGYVGGGTTNTTDGVSSAVFEYNPNSNSWAKKENILDGIVYGAKAVGVDDKGFILGGQATNFVYGLGSNKFSQFVP